MCLNFKEESEDKAMFQFEQDIMEEQRRQIEINERSINS